MYTVKESIVLLAVSSLVLAIISSHLMTHEFPPSLYIFIIRYLHFFIFLFAITYAFLFHNNTLDILFILYILFLVIHWELFGDCILNILESKYYQKNVPNIYLYTIFQKHTRKIMILAGSILIISFVIVLVRQWWVTPLLRVVLVFGCIPIALYQLNRQYTYDYSIQYLPMCL